MQLRIRGIEVAPARDVRDAIERSVRNALGRHTPGIEQTRVTLSTSDGPQIRCEIRVTLRQDRPIAATHEHGDPLESVAGAVQRIVRQLDRRHELAMDATPRRRADRR